MSSMKQDQHTDEKEDIQDFLHKPYMTSVMFGIVVLLVCVIALLALIPGRSKKTADGDSALQQSIADYAQQQKENDQVSGLSGETVDIEERMKNENADARENDDTASEPVPGAPEPETGAGKEEEYVPTAADSGKEAVVVEAEDENSEAYSKEYILNEALPYFADNNHAAISDLAHLKRYVKLSNELTGTGQYYYIGDVNQAGQPDGRGLAIYEDNSYYYGDWDDGVKSGGGRWFRFYINEKSERNRMGIYTSHSYAGDWANDLPNGEGAEHYDVDVSAIKSSENIPQNYVGRFVNGFYDGDMYLNTVDLTGNVKEWDGTADKGEFSLWREMSAIGECSIWKNKQDDTLCLDVDQSENGSLGITELMKPAGSEGAQ